MRKTNFHRRCLERINLSWFVTKTKHLLGILNCRHFDAVCFYGNIMAPIPSRAEITHATLIMRSHFATVFMQPWFTVYFFDIGHPCYDQLTPVKTRYPLTSIT